MEPLKRVKVTDCAKRALVEEEAKDAVKEDASKIKVMGIQTVKINVSSSCRLSKSCLS